MQGLLNSRYVLEEKIAGNKGGKKKNLVGSSFLVRAVAAIPSELD